MSTSDVRNIDALATFGESIERLAGELSADADGLNKALQRIDVHFGQAWPAYWEDQLRVAQRRWTESQDRLNAKRAAVRPGDRPPATEEAASERRWRDRVRVCREKVRGVRRLHQSVAAESDKVRGPLADLRHAAETDLPAAAEAMRRIVETLRRYSEDG